MKSDAIMPGEVGHPARVELEYLRVDADGRVYFPVYGDDEEDVPCYFAPQVLEGLASKACVGVPDRTDAVAVRGILDILAVLDGAATVRFAVRERVIEVARVEWPSKEGA